MSNSHIAALVLAWIVGFGLTDLIGLEASASGAADRQSHIRQVNGSLVKEMHAETANG